MRFKLLIPIVCLLILLGGFFGLLMIIGRYWLKKEPYRTGNKLVAVLVCLSLVTLLILGVRELILSRPDAKDLVGEYHLTKVTVPSFNQSKIKNYSLTFFANGRYLMTPISDLDLGETGTYKVDYSNSLNEIIFTYKYEYGNASFTAHIDRGLGSYSIEFIVDDPDTGESYYFEKDK